MKLTIQEALKALDGKVAKSTLYQAVERKKLAHYRISGTGRRGKILIDESDLTAWLESQKVGVSEEKRVSPAVTRRLHRLSLD